MNINLATERLKNNLIELINESGLPAANVYLIWQSMMKNIETAYISAVKQALAEEEEEEMNQPTDVENNNETNVEDNVNEEIKE